MSIVIKCDVCQTVTDEVFKARVTYNGVSGKRLATYLEPADFCRSCALMVVDSKKTPQRRGRPRKESQTAVHNDSPTA